MVRWDVDDRRPSPWTRLYVLGMRLARDDEAFEGEAHTRRVALERQRSGDRPPTGLTRLLRRVSTSTHAGMTVWTVRPRRRTPVARVVHVHGGGYVHPLTPDYWRLVRALTRAPAEVVVPAYPLAPGHTVDEVLPKLLDLVTSVQSREPRLPVVLIGDSAGGALVLVLARRLRDGGSTPAAGVVALCPWLDATLSQEEVRDLEPSDPMLAESGLRAAGRWWAGVRAPEDPEVSPVAQSVSGLPPIDVFIGDHDILRPAVDDLARRAAVDGADLTIHETPAMFHVWMTRAVPEGRRTRRELAALVAQRATDPRR